MEIALLAMLILGLIAVLLSFENDRMQKGFTLERKSQEDRIYKLSVLKEIQEKIAYNKDPEKVIDTIMAQLRNFFPYSVAASMVVKDAHVIFKAYVEEQVGSDYIKSVEEEMLSSFGKLIGNIPDKMDKKTYGIPLNDPPAGGAKSSYSSSFHIPLIANNKVLAMIHLSSTAENLYKDMADMHELIDAAALALTHFNQAIEVEDYISNQLIKSINDGIFMADNKNNLLLINDTAKNILGINRENISFFEVANIFSDSLNLAAKVHEVISSNNSFIAKGIQINKGVFDVFINPVSRDKASIVLHDMTEYKKKEMLKEDLTHIMVHELRAPVTTIKDSAELIISTNTLDEERKLKFLEMIHNQSKKVLGQIGSILDTAKLDAGKLVLQKTKGDIAKLIESDIQTFMPQAERKNISLNFETIAKSIPEISFDEIRISQVIDNLLSNSLKFTPEGGKIKVEVDYKAIPPTEKFLSLDKYIVVSVSDTGVGIAPEQQKLLFSKYTQAENTSEEVATQGTGLGLYLVKGIVESHNGRIWVKSGVGQGTTFSFSLPSTDDTKTSYDAPKSATTPLAKLSQTVN